MTIYLKYSNDNWDTETSDSFDAISHIVTIERNKEVSNTLNGTIVNHLKDKRNKAEIIISANELYIPANVTFLDNFFNANARKYSTDDVTYIVVEATDEPDITFINGNKKLPQYAFTLINKYKD